MRVVDIKKHQYNPTGFTQFLWGLTNRHERIQLNFQARASMGTHIVILINTITTIVICLAKTD